jgi:nucleoside-diphosphate kinase
MSEEQTLVLIKPDATQRGLVGRILARFEAKGLQIVGLRQVLADRPTAACHYAEHEGRHYYPKLIRFITSAPLVALALAGDDAIAVVRRLVGKTDGRLSEPGTIRGDFSISNSANLVHASDGPESAARELAIWFPDGVLDWQQELVDWLDVKERAHDLEAMQAE